MRKSLFSSLKVVALMLATGKKPQSREKKWFFQIVRNYGASLSEMAELSKILDGNSTEQVGKLVSEVDDEFDRRRLLNFLQMAMRQDGIVQNAEIQLFYEVQKELETSLRNDYVAWGREIHKRENEIREWRELDQLGKAFSHKLTGFPFSAHHYYTADPIIWYWSIGKLDRHKGKLAVLLIIFAAGFLLLH